VQVAIVTIKSRVARKYHTKALVIFSRCKSRLGSGSGERFDQKEKETGCLLISRVCDPCGIGDAAVEGFAGDLSTAEAADARAARDPESDTRQQFWHLRTEAVSGHHRRASESLRRRILCSKIDGLKFFGL
jgi:hypothetical protein